MRVREAKDFLVRQIAEQARSHLVWQPLRKENETDGKRWDAAIAS
jgi:hypothetical protein